MAEGEQDSNPVKTDSADDDTDEESEVLEESPCGRWQKRREEVWFFRMNHTSSEFSFFLSLDTALCPCRHSSRCALLCLRKN